jgi:hypothetical protein
LFSFPGLNSLSGVGATYVFVKGEAKGINATINLAYVVSESKQIRRGSWSAGRYIQPTATILRKFVICTQVKYGINSVEKFYINSMFQSSLVDIFSMLCDNS